MKIANKAMTLTGTKVSDLPVNTVFYYISKPNKGLHLKVSVWGEDGEETGQFGVVDLLSARFYYGCGDERAYPVDATVVPDYKEEDKTL